jgi:hypothetical protein
VAFKLDRDTHLFAWVSTAYVAASTSYTTGWIGGANLANNRPTVIRQSHALKPSKQFFVPQHEPSPEITSFAVLPPALILQRIHEPHPSFVDQFLQLTAVLDGLLNVWSQVIGYID